MPHSIVQRAQIVLACGADESNTASAKQMGLTGMSVGKWRKRYRAFGIEGLHDGLYALRKIIVESVFGQIKGAQCLDCFLLRGLEKVNGEWSLMAITHNIGKLHRAAMAAN